MNAAKAGRWAVRVLVSAFALIMAFAVTVVVIVPRATHGTAMTVLTGSMSPKIPAGSLVVDVPVDPGTLKVGDVATYQAVPGKAEFVTHRVVAIDTSQRPTEFTFKGDANRGPDLKPVPATAIRGRVLMHLPYVGRLKDGLHGQDGAKGVAFAAVVGYMLWQAVTGFRERKQTRAEVAR